MPQEATRSFTPGNGDDWSEQLEESLQAYEAELEKAYARIDDLERELARTAEPAVTPAAEVLELPAQTVPGAYRLDSGFVRWGLRLLRRISDLGPRESVRPASTSGQKPLLDRPGLRVDPGARTPASPLLSGNGHVGAPSHPGRVLIIDHRLPTTDRDCGSVRMMELMRLIISRGHSITFLPDNFFVWPPYLEDLEAVGVEVVHPSRYRYAAQFLKERGHEFGLAIISRAGIAARHLTTVRRLAPQARIVFDTVDLHFLREERQARISSNPALTSAGATRKRQELRLARLADLTVVVSPAEKDLLERECPGIDVAVIPTIYPLETARPPGFARRRHIVFIGGFDHAPNVDSVLYFATEIFPLVQSRVPGAEFQIIGSQPPTQILALASDRVKVLGFVPDVKPVFDRARLSVAPIRFGAGVKGKVNQSMALGVPAVVTSIAAEGMHLVHEHNAMIADDPHSFADAVARVWNSRELWERLSAGGVRNLRDHFSVEAAARPIDAMLEWAGLGARPTASLGSVPRRG